MTRKLLIFLLALLIAVVMYVLPFDHGRESIEPTSMFPSFDYNATPLD